MSIVFVLVLAAEADETRQTVSFLIACLVGIAIALTVLTVWYWFYTDPGRRRANDQAETELIDDPVGPEAGFPPPRPGPPAGAVEVPAGSEMVADVASADGASAGVGVGVGAHAGAGSELEPGSSGARADDPAAADGPAEADEDFVVGPVLARQTWDFVAAAKRAEDDRPTVERSTRPATPRIAVPDRSAAEPVEVEADELAVVRRRREREAARGLSDELWDSVRRSVFDKLDG